MACKNICHRLESIKHASDNIPDLKDKRAPYETGVRAFCTICNKIMRRKDVINFRCPCCNTVVRTNSRTKSKRALMTVD